MSPEHETDIFGRTFDCECGRTHTVEPAEVLYERGAVTKLPRLCPRATQGRRVTVLMDVRTRDVAGSKACAALAQDGWQVTPVLVPDPAEGRSPVCDDMTKERLSAEMRAADLVVSVGSGVITDLSRWVAAEQNLAFVSFATAASMNGYCSANVAATVKGVKTLLWARPPVAVVADPVIIESAPWELTAAGLGDILAKSVSAADWYLNHLLFGDYYCARAMNLIANIEPTYMERPEDLKARAPKAVEALFHGLLLAGVAMTMAGTSAPASGGEHLVSHALDMMSSLDNVEHDLHGRQVGIGTVLCSELYRRVLAVESPEFVEPCTSVDRGLWSGLAGAVAEHYERKVARLRFARQKLAQGDTWDSVREGLAPLLRSPGLVHGCLARAGAACRAEHIRCSRERLLMAFLHAHEIRSRFTVLDLARLVGVMPQAAREIAETWA